MKALQTNYCLINEAGKLEVIHFAPDQNTCGQRDSDQYACAQGLFMDAPSHDYWLTSIPCHRTVGTPSGLQTVKGLSLQIVAKEQYIWDMSKPMGNDRKTELKQSKKWSECLKFYTK